MTLYWTYNRPLIQPSFDLFYLNNIIYSCDSVAQLKIKALEDKVATLSGDVTKLNNKMNYMMKAIQENTAMQSQLPPPASSIDELCKLLEHESLVCKV